MPRPYRIQYPNAIYHVMNRGLNRQPIFKEKSDFESFLKLCEKSWERWGLQVFAYCLMDNHYHLCLQTPEGNLSRIMRHIDGLYTQSFNRRHGRDGPIFRGRYKAILVQQEEYLSQLVRYVHLNPVKAKLVKLPKDYAYSSHHTYLSLKKPPAWLNIDLVRDSFKGRKAFDTYVLEGSTSQLEQSLASKRSPIILGTKDFIQEIKKLVSKPDLAHARHERQRLRPSIAQIIQVLAKAYNVTEASIVHGVRGQENEARKVAMWFCKEYGDHRYRSIAKAFHVKSSDTVAWSCRQVEKTRASSKGFKKKLEKIGKELNNQ